MYQVWNNSITEFPMATVNNQSDIFSYWFWGEGIWKCRVNEFRKFENTLLFDEWVNNNLLWLGSNSDQVKELEIVTSKDECDLGNLFRFKVVRKDASGNRIVRDELMAKVEYGNGKSRPVILVKNDDEFVGSFVPEYEGVMNLSVSVKSKPSISAEKRISVNGFSLEKRITQSDFDFLRKWARRSGGEFVFSQMGNNVLTNKRLANNKNIPRNNNGMNVKSDAGKMGANEKGKSIVGNSRIEERERIENAIADWIVKNKLDQVKITEEIDELNFREWWVYLLIITGLFSGEWIIRKRLGMEF
jgi:hypothetical protein